MTTITSESIPTTTSTTTSSRTWRYVATFAAGVVLSVGVAAGISAATDDSPTTPAPAGSVGHASSNDQCAMFAGKPC